MRVCAVNGTTTASGGRLDVDAADRGQLDDRGALGRGVGERRERGRAGELVAVHARHADEVGRAPVAVGDRAGLVEQQGRDVAGGLDGAARHREDVALHEPVHAGDADRGEERADRRRDEADEQRDEHRDADRGRRVGGDRVERQHDDHEDDRQAREQDVQRDLVGRLLAAGALDERDHAVDERLARLRGDAHDDAVGEHARAAGDGAAVAARLADDRGGLARDGRLVDGRDAPHDVAVAGDQLAGRHDDDVAERQVGRGDLGRSRARSADGIRRVVVRR